jgi:ABC-type uncharacterized transport system auxiliary subunit
MEARMRRLVLALVAAATLCGCGTTGIPSLQGLAGEDPMRLTVEQYAMRQAGLVQRAPKCPPHHAAVKKDRPARHHGV